MHLRVKERTADLQRELARRQQLEKEIAVVAEEERTRVGRELHDSLGQHLAGTGLLAETVANQLEKENNTIQPTARKVVRLIDQGIELTREIARGLYSSELDGDGLFSALESLSRSVGKSQVKCEFEHSGKPPRSKELATQVYWVAREAVTNALKHAQPQHVWIHLRTTDDYLRLKVEDDGRGLSQSTREGWYWFKSDGSAGGNCRRKIANRKGSARDRRALRDTARRELARSARAGVERSLS